MRGHFSAISGAKMHWQTAGTSLTQSLLETDRHSVNADRTVAYDGQSQSLTVLDYLPAACETVQNPT